MDKTQFNVYLPKPLLTDFRGFVAAKYGEVKKGYLGFEVAAALRSHIDTHKSTQSHVSKTTKEAVPNVLTYASEVTEYLRDHFGYEDLTKVHKNHVMMAISVVRGTDRRTIKKWMKLFEQWKVIRWVGANHLEFLKA